MMVGEMMTKTMRIKSQDIGEFQKELKNWNIRHFSFEKYGDHYVVNIYSNPKVDFLVLKYLDK